MIRLNFMRYIGCVKLWSLEKYLNRVLDSRVKKFNLTIYMITRCTYIKDNTVHLDKG